MTGAMDAWIALALVDVLFTVQSNDSGYANTLVPIGGQKYTFWLVYRWKTRIKNSISVNINTLLCIFMLNFDLQNDEIIAKIRKIK